MWYNTYGRPKNGNFGYETPSQFPFRPQPVGMTPARATIEPCANPNNLTNQLATILRESFSIEPKDQGHVYQRYYPIITINYLTLEVTELPSSQNLAGKMVKPHSIMLANLFFQYGEASANDALKLRMFPLSLSGIAFTWFTSIAPNSIFTWARLE
jgi:hypothetical protein